MNKNMMFLTVLMLFVLTGCGVTNNHSTSIQTTSLVDRHNELIGCWEGAQRVISGNYQEWQRCLESDGTYIIKMFSSDKTKKWQRTESGRWAYSNGIYTTVRLKSDGEKVDPLDRENQGVYLVKEISSTSMHYLSLRTGNWYTATRIK